MFTVTRTLEKTVSDRLFAVLKFLPLFTLSVSFGAEAVTGDLSRIAAYRLALNDSDGGGLRQSGGAANGL